MSATEATASEAPEAPGVKHSRAWVTLVMLGDKYVPGAAVMAHSLRDAGTRYPIVCMVTPDVSADARRELARAFDSVVEVPYITHPTRPFHGQRSQELYGSWIDSSFTKWNCLGLPYERVIFTDSDFLYRANCDDLFGMPAPAACFSNRWGIPYTPAVKSGVTKAGVKYTPRAKGGIPNDYPVAHGARVPASLIRRNTYDRPSFVGTGSQVLLAPAPGALERYIRMVKAEPVFGVNTKSVSGADEVSIALFCLQEGQEWTHLDQETQSDPWRVEWVSPQHAASGRPARAVHYIGEKPWLCPRQWPDQEEWWACASRHEVAVGEVLAPAEEDVPAPAEEDIPAPAEKVPVPAAT